MIMRAWNAPRVKMAIAVRGWVAWLFAPCRLMNGELPNLGKSCGIQSSAERALRHPD